MCGIVAAFRYGNNGMPVQEDVLIRMRDSMTVRGPDGAGIWLSGNRCVGLAHRRLSIIDLTDAGSQPMTTSDGVLRIVFNGEIYNYLELRRRLEEKGHVFRSDSDTEVLLHLYREYGQEMVHHLRGMYAFVIWDDQKRGMLLVRDPFGIKPLYYADDGNTLLVASQVKALLKGGRVATTPEPAGHVGFLLWGFVPEPYTLYKDIRSLSAGTILWVDQAGRREMKKFCNISEELARFDKSYEKIGKQEIQERLRQALLDSVSHHQVADVPVGVFLSSGLDSTTLLALASETARERVHTITLAFHEYAGTGNDESPLAEQMAQIYGTVHRTQFVSAVDYQAEAARFLNAMDQPTIDGVNTYFVSKIAAESGLKVALSGLGGDELFGGYPSFHQIPKTVNVLGPTQHFPFVGRAFRKLSAGWIGKFTSPKYAGLLEYGNTYGGAYLLRRGLFMPWELQELLDPELVREGWLKLQPLLRLEESVKGIQSDHLKVSALELTWYMRSQLLRDTDWASMAHSLEVRVPLVDLSLLREIMPLFYTEFPPTKLDMAQTPAKTLPYEVLTRRKTGFSVPVHEWLLQTNEGNGYLGRGLRGWAKKVYEMYRCDV